MGEGHKSSEIEYRGWHVVRRINSGSFGSVYEIEKEDFGHQYRSALKVIRVPESEEELKAARKKNNKSDESLKKYMEGMAADILNEIDYMYQLKGTTNIVSYEDHEFRKNEDGIGWQIMIRMELLTPLEDYMEKHHMEREDVIRLGIHICRALERCCKKDIVHRDIKPGNIFISEQGDFKLGDFGIARIVDAHDELVELTGHKGTINYMAPEINNNSPVYGFDVDLYSLGIVMYRLLNYDTLPFHEDVLTYLDKSKANARRFSGEAIPRPRGDDTQLADVVLKACSFKPEDRYRSARQMREHLEMLLRGEEIDWSVELEDDEDTLKKVVEGHVVNDSEKTMKKNPSGSDLTDSGRPDQGQTGLESQESRFTVFWKKRKIVLLVVVILAMAGAVYLAGIIKPVPTPPLSSTETSTNEPTTKDGSGLEDLIEQKNFVAAYNEIQERTRKGENLDSVIYSFVRACELESQYKRAVAAMRMLSDQVADNADFYRETVKWFYGHDNGEFARQILTDLRNKGPEGEKLANEISSGYDDDNKETDD